MRCDERRLAAVHAERQRASVNIARIDFGGSYIIETLDEETLPDAFSPARSTDYHGATMHTDPASDSFDEGHLLGQISKLPVRLAQRLISADEAEDIAQLVVLQCLSEMRAGRWRVDRSLEALVRAMVKSRHVRVRRAAKRRIQREEQYVADRLACPPVWMDPARMLEVLGDERLRERAMTELSEEYRAAFALVREEGASLTEAAVRLGVSRGIVRAQVGRAEQHLASRLRITRPWRVTPPSMAEGARQRSVELRQRSLES